MKKIIAILVFGLTGSLISGCTQGSQRISLRFKFEPGMRLSYEQISKSNYRVIKQDSVTLQKTSTYTASAVQDFIRFVDDTTAEVRELNVWEHEVPSEEDSTKMEKVTKTMETRLQILPNGKIVDVQFDNEIEEARVTYIRNYYEQGVPVFPSGEKPVGYAWTQSTRVVLPEETMEASTTYQIKSLVRQSGYDCAVLEYEGNLIIPVQPKPEDSTQRQGLDHITAKGLLYFAYKEGVIVEQVETWIVDGDRQRLEGGDTVYFRVETEYSTTYRLVNREIGT